MNVVTIPKYVLVLFISILIVSSAVIGFLLFKTDFAGEPEGKDSEISEISDKCQEKNPQDISWENLASIEKIGNNTSYGVVMTIKKYDENRTEIGSCKFYITDYIEGALGISNSEVGGLTNIVYIGSATIAYQYHDAIFVQKIEEGAKASVVVDQSLASKTSLNDAGEQLIFGGPFLVDDSEWPGISTHGRFLFTVNFTYTCEDPSSVGSCSEMISLSKELKEKGVLGLWLYKNSAKGEIIRLSGDIENIF